MKNVILFILMLSFYANLFSQESILDYYAHQGLQNNLEVNRHQVKYEIGQKSIEEARGLFMPQISFSTSYTQAGGGRAFEFPLGDLVNPIHQALNSMMAENPFPTNLKNINENFIPNNFHETRFRIIQPLYQPSIPINLQLEREQAYLKLLEKSAFEKSLVRDIKKAYLEYLKTHEAVKIYKKNKQLLEDINMVNQKLVKHEKVLKDAVYNTQYELLEVEKQLQMAKRDQQLAKAYFNFLINRPQEEEIEIDTVFQSLIEVDLNDQLLTLAKSNRIEFNQVATARRINDQLIRLAQSDYLPTIHLVGDVGFQGFGYKLNGNQDYWMLNLTMNWNLFQGNQRKKRLEKANLQESFTTLQSAQLFEQVKLQLNRAMLSIRAQQTALEAMAAKVKAAGENYRMLRKRYQYAQALPIEVLDARNKLTQAQIQLNIAHYDLMIAKVQLEWVVGL